MDGTQKLDVTVIQGFDFVSDTDRIICLGVTGSLANRVWGLMLLGWRTLFTQSQAQRAPKCEELFREHEELAVY